MEKISNQHVPSGADDEPDACPSDDDEYDLELSGSEDVLDSM